LNSIQRSTPNQNMKASNEGKFTITWQLLLG
jgi:hypothetical protein